MGNSTIKCDEIIEETIPTNLNENKANHKTQNFYILLSLFINCYSTIDSCYLIKYRGKQKHLLPLNFTNNKLKEILY